MTERKSQNHKRMQVSPHTIFQAIGQWPQSHRSPTGAPHLVPLPVYGLHQAQELKQKLEIKKNCI